MSFDQLRNDALREQDKRRLEDMREKLGREWDASANPELALPYAQVVVALELLSQPKSAL
jgi:hypothetical protein